MPFPQRATACRKPVSSVPVLCVRVPAPAAGFSEPVSDVGVSVGQGGVSPSLGDPVSGPAVGVRVFAAPVQEGRVRVRAVRAAAGTTDRLSSAGEDGFPASTGPQGLDQRKKGVHAGPRRTPAPPGSVSRSFFRFRLQGNPFDPRHPDPVHYGKKGLVGQRIFGEQKHPRTRT